MKDTTANLSLAIEELKVKLEMALDRSDYYRRLAEDSGKKRIREIDLLSRLNDEQKKTKEKLKYRLDLDNLLHAITTKFMDHPRAKLGKKIELALKKTGEFYLVDSSFLVMLEKEQTTSDKVYEWCKEGVGFRPKDYISDSYHDYPDIVEVLLHRDIVYYQRADTSADKNFPEIFRMNDIQSMIVLPLFFEKNNIGFMGFVSIEREKVWNDEDVIVLKTLADILVSAIHRDTIEKERKKLEEQLQIRQRIDSLGTLAGGIAHDLNNLLVAIIGNIDLVRMSAKTLPDNLQEYIDDALQASKRAANFIREIQAFSKGSVTGKSSVDVFVVVQKVLDILERTTNKLIDKKLDIEPDTFHVIANEDLLYQALFNLGINAIQAIEDLGDCHGNYIRFRAKHYRAGKNDKTGLPPGDYVHLFVEDTGVGMSERVKAKAFDPLYTTRRTSGKGQGLGLAMVYNIITKNHDGCISIESYEGNGTTFHIYLPASKEIKTEKERRNITSTGGNETVLVIDDDEAVRNFVRDSLHYYGYKVITAVDGHDGVDKFTAQQSKIQIVLLDITMPNISGGSVLKHIISLQPEAKVIMCSGHSEEDMHQFEHASGYLTKPFDMQSLAHKIRMTLDMN